MRSIGLDVHRDFCEVAIFEKGKVARHPRVPARREALVAFASSLRPTDQVGLEATGNALVIARLIEPHVARVAVANAAVTKTIGATSFKARAWPGKPPWHDRIYLWKGGGLSVGTSPSGLGHRVARLDRLNANEAAGWQTMFNAWWVDPTVAAV